MVRFHRSEYEASGYEEQQYKAKKRLTLLRDNLKPMLKSKLNLRITPNNAFIKLFEILKLNQFLIPKRNKVYTFHLAEAPGHFIKCVESFIKQRNFKYNGNTQYNWWANSLNPYNHSVRARFPKMIADNFGLIRINIGLVAFKIHIC